MIRILFSRLSFLRTQAGSALLAAALDQGQARDGALLLPLLRRRDRRKVQDPDAGRWRVGGDQGAAGAGWHRVSGGSSAHAFTRNQKPVVSLIRSVLRWAGTAGGKPRQTMSLDGASRSRESFQNTVLGQTWADTGELLEPDRLFNKREHFELGVVPSGGLFLTGAVDVMRDRLEVSVEPGAATVNAGASGTRSSWATPPLMGPGAGLRELLVQLWPHVSGAPMVIWCMGLDCGYRLNGVPRTMRTASIHLTDQLVRGSSTTGLRYR